MDEEEKEKQGSSVSQKVDSAKSTTKKLKDFMSKFKKSKAANKTLVKALAKVLVSAGWVILIFIIVVGIIMFFLTMPGMVMEKLKGLFKAIASAWGSWWGDDDAASFENVEIYNVLNYLDEMGYDLKGYGFVTKFLTNTGDTTSTSDIDGYDQGGAEGDPVPEEKRKSTKDGVIRNTEDNKVITGVSEFINTYLISENYLYTIKNFNVVGNGWDAFWNHVKAGVFGTTSALNNRSGMLMFWKDGGIVGNRGPAYEAAEMGYVTFDTDTKKLLIKKGWTNNAMAYSLDGWTGRYGMPVDFLLTIHLATQMPDLAYDMANTFKTEVNILLHTTTGQVEGQYKTDSGKYIGHAELNKALNGLEGKNVVSSFINWLDNLGVSAAEAQTAIDMGLAPPEHGNDCGCKTELKDVYVDEKGAKHSVYKKTTTVATNTASTTNTTSTTEEKYYYYDFNNDEEIEVSESDIQQAEIISELGANCKAYIKAVLNELAEPTDFHYETYSPYIESVENHWYRNVYFVANANRVDKFVDYDYQYELITGERWTMYETDSDGEFIYYVMDEETGETTDEIYTGNVVSGEIVVKDENGNQQTGENGEVVTERIASRGEDGTLVVKKAKTINLSEKYEDLGWNQITSSLYMAYDPKTQKESTIERRYTDDEIASESDEITKSVKERIYVKMDIDTIVQTGEGLREETNPDIKKMFMANKYFKYDGSQQRAEVIHALREAIKNEGYDGYGPISEEILEKFSDKPIDLTFAKYPNGDYTSEVQDGKYNLEEYIGSVSFQQDALNTFAMIENSHTLDSDYIYKDFKELVVELGYFEKEELTESKPKLLQWVVPDIGSGGYPDRSIDKREAEYGTMVHSKMDIDAHAKATIANLISQMAEAEGLDGVNEFKTDPAKGLRERMGSGSNVSLTEVGSIDTAERTPEQVSIDEFIESTREMCEYINKEGYDYCVLVGDAGDGEQNCNHAPVHSNECGLQSTFEASQASTEVHNLCCATLVSWALQKVGVLPPSLHSNSASGLSKNILDNLNPEKIQVGEPLQPGDILCYDGHIDLVGEETDGGFVKYNGGAYVQVGATEFGQNSCIQKISGWPDDSRIQFALRLNWGGKNKGGKYVGYEGNEAVVSPVTGILMEYGTYDEESAEENRENIDLKYNGLLEGKEFETETVVDPETGEETTKIKYPSDKVGYAVIKVLDAETYKKLESTVTNKWKDNSLVKVNEKSENYEAVNKHISFKEETDELVSKERNWTPMEETVYGYKEFVELYEQFGIGGYYVYIDGFKCESVDESLLEKDETNPSDKDKTENKKVVPKGEALTIDSFKISETDVNNENYEPKTETLYETDEVSKLVSKEYTKKLKAESAIKSDASIGITFNYNDIEVDEEGNSKTVNNEYILIKEGTVLGRTLTDFELLEDTNYRNKTLGTYDEYVEAQKEFLEEGNQQTGAGSGTTSNLENSGDEKTSLEDLVTNNVPLVGNYLRLIMQEENGDIVENIEDYMKLDENVSSSENDWELFYWLPFESGGTDIPGSGPECQGSCSDGETAVGIIQWTVLTSDNMNNIGSQFIPGCLEANSSLCAPLAAYQSWSATDFWNDYNGAKQFQSTLKSICATNRDEFLHCQMEVAKKQYLEPILEEYSWLAERPSCVQGEIMHLKVWGADYSWVGSMQGASDEEIIRKVRYTIANTSSTAGEATGDETKGRAFNEPQIALEILSGGMSAEDVEQWVRTKDTKWLSFSWKS